MPRFIFPGIRPSTAQPAVRMERMCKEAPENGGGNDEPDHLPVSDFPTRAARGIKTGMHRSHKPSVPVFMPANEPPATAFTPGTPCHESRQNTTNKKLRTA